MPLTITAALFMMLTASATPPPAAPAGTPPRIEGLARTFVTPEAFVDGLNPGAPASEGFAKVLFVSLNLEALAERGLTVEAVAEALRASPDVEKVERNEASLRVQLAAYHPLTDLSITGPKGDSLLGELAMIRSFPVVPVRLPGSPSQAPPIPTKLEAPEPGWDLELINTMVGLVTVSVEGVEIGELHPLHHAVIHNVRPGRYEVVYATKKGFQRRTVVPSVRAEGAE